VIFSKPYYYSIFDATHDSAVSSVIYFNDLPASIRSIMISVIPPLVQVYQNPWLPIKIKSHSSK